MAADKYGKLDLGDLALRIKELRHRQEQLHTRKNEIENELADRRVELIDLETMTSYAAEMQDIIYEGSLAHRKAFIRGFVKDIRVTEEKAVLSYSSSLQLKPMVGSRGLEPLTSRM